MKKIRLKEITTKIGSGATPRGGKKTYLGGEVSLVRSMNVHDNFFDRSGLAKINSEQAKKLDNVELEEGDVLINITGASVARVNTVPKDILPARVNQHVSIIRPNKKKLDGKFFHYYLIQSEIKQKLRAISLGSSREGITKDSLNNFLVTIPDISTQKKIAKVLYTIDAKIELNAKINDELKRMARQIYEYWFMQFDFLDENNRSYKSSGGKMVYNNELAREIPKGWLCDKLGNYLEIKRGSIITAKKAQPGDIKVVAAGLDFSYYHNKYNREGFTISVSSSGANAGFVNFWLEPIWASDTTTVRGNSDGETIMIYHFLKSLQEVIYSYAKGSAQPHVYPSDISNFQFIQPSEEVLFRFESIVKPMYKKIQKNNRESYELMKQRDYLLPMLMNGQINVNDIRVDWNDR